VDEALATWATFSPATRALVGQVNVHGYEEGGDRAGLYRAVVVESHKSLRDSEYGDGDGSGLTLAASFLEDWRTLHPDGWTYWQLLDEAGGWGALRFDASAKAILAVNTKHFVLAQLSRHLRPGMIALGTQNSTIPAAAAWQEGTGSLQVVLLNSGQAELSVEVDPPAFSLAGTPPPPDAFVTSLADSTPNPSSAYTPTGGGTLTNKVLSLKIPALSLLSLSLSLK